MVDFQFLGYTAIGVAILAIIALIGAYWSAIVSTLSHVKDRMVEEGEARREYRRRVYGSGIEPDSIGIEPSVPLMVLSAQEAENTGTSIPVRELTSRADVLDILARAKVDGKYLFTGNKLADLFTGTAYAASRNIILEEIAAIRNPEKPAIVHRAGAPLKRPATGW